MSKGPDFGCQLIVVVKTNNTKLKKKNIEVNFSVSSTFSDIYSRLHYLFGFG